METLEGEERYSRTIRQLLDDHQSVVTHLAEGFHECQKNVSVSQHCITVQFVQFHTDSSVKYLDVMRQLAENLIGCPCKRKQK